MYEQPVGEYETLLCTNCHSSESSIVAELEDYLYRIPGNFAMRCCAACGLLFLSPRPTRAAINRYYPASYAPYRPAIQDEKSRLMRWMRRRKLVQRRQAVERHWAAQRGNLLDVGCSTGIFLDEMRSAGWQTRGIEISPTAAEYARNRFALDVQIGDLLEIDLPSASFDLITMWDVLEHTFAPRDVLAKSAMLLKPGGLLALTFPNWESLDRKLFGRYWVGYDAPRHLHIFPDPVIRQMLHEAGFDCIEDGSRFGGYFAFITSLRTWLRAGTPQHPSAWPRWGEKIIDFPGIRFPFEPLILLLDRIGMGGVRFVVARKRPASNN
ncbi:MAG: class I SAM-dependent methyltransferase [Caldilineaceae bacterium]